MDRNEKEVNREEENSKKEKRRKKLMLKNKREREWKVNEHIDKEEKWKYKGKKKKEVLEWAKPWLDMASGKKTRKEGRNKEGEHK